MTNLRAVPGTVIELPIPAISGGHPSLPIYWAKFLGAATLKQGPLHIHAIRDPNPLWDPATGGWTYPPPPIRPRPIVRGVPVRDTSGAGDYRWTVDSLPNPNDFSGGWYWLGDPTSRDGTASMPSGGRQWATAPGGPAGPSWRSFFPYKPSVNGYDAYIVGERSVHHAKGVHCNSHYIEHMWLDFGWNMLQPFTWIVVATVMSDPFPGHEHHILDAGRSAAVGDNLPYRTRLSWRGDTAAMQSQALDAPLRVRGAPGHHPRMFATIFNGRQSQVSVYDPYGRHTTHGQVGGGPGYSHRYTVFGREQGYLSQTHASNIMVFEMRYWHHALTETDLAAQYAQLSSTYQFDAYKQL